MIRVLVDVGPLGVQLLGQFDVWVRLNGEGLADGEHLEEEREVVPEFRPRLLAQGTLVVRDVLLEGPTRAGQDRGPVGMRAHPEFGVGLALVNFKVGIS